MDGELKQKMSLIFDPKILAQHVVLLGKTGAGKSSALRHVVEYLLRHKKRVCIVDPKGDWWGLKSSADGKSAGFPVIAFGDFKDPRASDVPINAQSGRHVAELITSGNRPCIIGFRGWMPGAMTKFWIDFASTLFNANSGELYLVGDEFHNFAPKGKIMDPESGKCLHWSNRIMSEGRGVGLICLIASQRPQKVHNDTLTCCETLIAMRVIHEADRQAVKDWVDGCGDSKQGSEVLNSLAGMARGEAFIWSPEIGFGPKRVTFPMFETFDSFAPPQLQKKVYEHGWADVDLGAVKEKLATVIEEAKANDPAELKREIGRLKQLNAKTQRPEPAMLEIREVPVLSKEEIMRLETLLGELQMVRKGMDQMSARIDGLHGEVIYFKTLLSKLSAPQRLLPLKPNSSFLRNDGAVARSIASSKPSSNGSEANCEVSGGLKRMMIALAHRPGLNKRQLGVRSGLSSTSGTFGTYLGKLRSSGWIKGNGEFVLTDAGAAALGEYKPLPEGEELLNFWLGELGDSGAGRMLRALANVYPHKLTKSELGNAATISHTSGTFGTYLGKLRTLELVEGRSELSAASEFFE